VLLKYSRFGHFTPFSVVPEIGNCTEQRGKWSGLCIYTKSEWMLNKISQHRQSLA
jgi:hypothetical protein